MNPAIEKELVEFKLEIEEKFAKSEMNRTFKFPMKEESEQRFETDNTEEDS